jgi:hypothetical protein
MARVVRGGAFNNNQRNVRCSIRNRNNPDNMNNGLGFRVVLSILFNGWNCLTGTTSFQTEAKNSGAYSWLFNAFSLMNRH